MMRILTGAHKGRKIVMPSKVRPTQDKVRKALFDILGDIEGLSFLELFAGSGAVGFEAVSRGVGELTLVEHDRGCLLALNKNIETLKAKACTTLPFDVEKAIITLSRAKRRFDIIFLDPPYYKGLATPNHKGLVGVPPSAATPNPNGRIGVPPSAAKKTLQMLGAYDILGDNGFIIAQHFKKDTLPETLGELSLLRRYYYGDTALSVYQKKG